MIKKEIFTVLLCLMVFLFTSQAFAQGGTWEIKAPMPTPRHAVAAAAVADRVYAIGGFGVGGQVGVNEVYDPATDTWESRAPLPSTPTDFAGTNGAVVNDTIYVIGGNASGSCSSAVRAYNPIADTWSSKTSMQTPRCHLAVVALNGLIYAIGGTNTSGSSNFSIVEVYDASTNTWTAAEPMPTPRSMPGAGVVNGTIHVIGGNGGLATNESYDPATNQWTTKEPMPTPRSGMAVAEVDGLLYVVGGYSGGGQWLTTVEAYDPSSNTWQTKAAMPTARGNPGAAVLDGVMYVMGGYDSQELATNEAFTPSALAPVANDDRYGTDEDTTLTVQVPGVLANDSDGGGALTAELVSAPTNGSLTLNADGSFSYTPNANFHGTDGFTYRARDAGGAVSTPATVTITVLLVNHPPAVANDTYSANEDTTLAVAAPGVLGNDNDPDGDALTAQLVSGPANGTLALNADGSFSYTPNANFHGTDSFAYRAVDTIGVSSGSATVTITVQSVNDPPVAGNDAYSTNEDTALAVAAPGVLGNDNDAADGGGALTAELVGAPANGSLTLNADGSFSYTPNANFHGTDGFTYRSRDADGAASTPATVTITVQSVNDPPVAGNDTATTTQGTAVSITVLGNDSDVDGDALGVASATNGANGQVVIDGDGIVTYTPSQNFLGMDSFIYTVTDGHGGSATASVTVTVTTKSGFVPPKPPTPSPPVTPPGKP